MNKKKKTSSFLKNIYYFVGCITHKTKRDLVQYHNFGASKGYQPRVLANRIQGTNKTLPQPSVGYDGNSQTNSKTIFMFFFYFQGIEKHILSFSFQCSVQ